MAESTRVLLLRTLLARYHSLRDQLARRLGSSELAADALHHVWKRLQDKDDLPLVTRPEGYLYKAALNAAKNLQRTDRRQLPRSSVDLETIIDIADEAPDPATIAAGRAAVGLLQAALDELSPRQQAVFRETFLGDSTQQDLADRYGVTVRTIQNDLRQAVEHCAQRLKGKIHFVSDARGASGKREGPTS